MIANHFKTVCEKMRKMTMTRHGLVLLFALTVTSTACRPERTVCEKWEPVDLSFTCNADVSNPFDVEFSALVTRPDGSAFEAGGFYDGENTWKIRLACETEGEWKLETRSQEKSLNNRVRYVQCTANTHPAVHGPLRVNEENPHHFIYQDGTEPFLLGYEADWLWAIDLGRDNMDRTHAFLDKLNESGFNYIIFNVFAYDTRWRTGKTEEQDFGPPEMIPWEGTYDKPDYSRFNLPYWQHYDRVVKALHERGMTAHIMFKVYNKAVTWPDKGSTEDDLYFKYVVHRYAAYPNIVWDYSKESYYEEDVVYKQDRLELIRETDPYVHPVTLHDDKEIMEGYYDELIDFHADQNHDPDMYRITLEQRAYRNWPVMNVEFGYEHGPGGLQDKTFGRVQSPEEVCIRAWKLAMAGAYVAYYYTYTAWDVVRLDDNPKGYAYFSIFSDFFSELDFPSFRPYGFGERAIEELPPDEGIYCMVNDREESVYFLPEARSFNLLAKHSAELKGFWLHPFTGERVELLPTGGRELAPPDNWQNSPIILSISKE